MNTIPPDRGTWLLSGVSLLCFGSFAWGVRRHFVRPARTPIGMHVVTAASVAGVATFGRRLAGRTPPRLAVLPAAVMSASLGLFWWAAAVSGRRRLALAFTSDAAGPVLRSGPWRHVRHPFYAAYMMFWAAAALAAGRGTAIAAGVLAASYIVAARGEERRFAASAQARTYADYRRDTPMFLPRWPSARRAQRP